MTFIMSLILEKKKRHVWKRESLFDNNQYIAETRSTFFGVMQEKKWVIGFNTEFTPHFQGIIPAHVFLLKRSVETFRQINAS